MPRRIPIRRVPKTLGEHFEQTRIRVNGVPDSTDGRYERRRAMIFDGMALGDHPLPPGDKEDEKRLLEKQALSIALIGCDVDLEIKELRSLAPRKGTATADFEADLHDGSTVRIELARLTDPGEKRYVDAFSEIVGRAQMALGAVPDLDLIVGGGEVFVRTYGREPTPQDIKAASSELVDYILTALPQNPPSTTLWPVGSQWPTLLDLGACVAHLDAIGPTRLNADLIKFTDTQKAALAQLPSVFEKKRSKFAEYSEGTETWLVLYCDTQLFYPLGIADALHEYALDPDPFARMLFGCFTAGVIFTKGQTAAEYRSLTSTG